MELSADERGKLEQLARIKRIATATLAGCFIVFLGAKWLSASYPAMGWVAAFAEAATIGGLADWYAVVVLFRHPMGLKIPHTAIIPENQARIGDNLGHFLERNFLTGPIVTEKLDGIDFAGEIVGYLRRPENAAELSELVVRLVPDVLKAVEETGFRDFAARRIAKQVQRTPVLPVATNLIDSFANDGRYQEILDDVFVALERVLSDKRTQEAIEKRVAAELPTVLYVFQTEGVILKRIIKTISALLQQVQEDPDHAIRSEFSELFRGYVERMKKSKRFENRIETFKSDLFKSEELATIADQIWANLEDYIGRDANRAHPKLARELTKMVTGFADQLASDERLRAEINRGARGAIKRLVAERKSSVSGFVADQVKGWDFRQLVTLIEANVGRDLQFIRFNGMLVGGIAGVLLYAIEGLIG
ncbi:DUF445 family protein [Rhizobiaceae bacterium]|nr:DUF445 family protein [Rhizobiaceae bacterium]